MLQRLIENQQQILNNQVAHFHQTQELLGYSTPRLFIILPKPRRKRDTILRPFREQFKLYFLCECDHHMDDGCHTPHRIHLVKHEGYDLVKVDESFKKYGSNILTIMEILRVGIATAGVVVPGFSHLGIVQGLESASMTFELASRNFRPLFDDAITSYKDSSNTAVERLRVIVEVNGGKFLVLSSWNYVHVAIKGRLHAKDLYEAMVKTPRIQHLAIAQQCVVTQDDLEALETAVTKTGIPWLSIHIHLAEMSRFKILSKCYNPIVQASRDLE